MRKRKEYAIDFLCFLIGSALYAGAISIFIKPNSLVTGGLSGISIIINALTDFPIGISIFILNVPLFLAGFKALGKSFVFKSLIATALVSIFTDLFSSLLPEFRSDKILTSIAGGLLCGMGLSLVFIRGGSTGGADIIGKIVNSKFKHIAIGRVMMVFDFAVILISLIVFKKVENALYSALMIGISTYAVDYFIYGSRSGKILLVFTKNSKELSRKINTSAHRGATIVPAIGAFSGSERAMLIIALKNHEITKMHSLIFESDKEAFVTILDAREIIGKGFNKNYE